MDALDLKLIKVDRHQDVVRRKQAPVEVEMNPHFERRERRRLGKIDNGAAGRIPAAAKNARPLARKIGVTPPADSPGETQAPRP